MGKGGVSASDRMRTDCARTSISPVARFSFTAPARLSTLPTTAATNSLRSLPAFAKPSSPTSPSSKMICRMPERSLRSTKMMPPLFLCFATHPMTVTVSPTLAAESSPHLWVLFRPFIDSAMSAPFAARGGPSYPLISLILSNSFPASPGKEFGMSFISAVLCKTPEIPPSPPS